MASRADVSKLDSTCLLQTLTAVRKGDFSFDCPRPGPVSTEKLPTL